MTTQFKSNGVTLTEDIKKYAEQKVQKLTKLLPTESDTRFEIELSDGDGKTQERAYRADIVAIAGKVDMHAVGHGETLQAAVDIAKDELARRLRRQHSKERDMLRSGSRILKRMMRRGEV